jgi:hypothetical protein
MGMRNSKYTRRKRYRIGGDTIQKAGELFHGLKNKGRSVHSDRRIHNLGTSMFVNSKPYCLRNSVVENETKGVSSLVSVVINTDFP